MSNSVRLMALSLLIAGFTCPAMAEHHGHDTDEAAITQVSVGDWCAADLSQDLNAKMSLYTADAVLIGPGLGPLEGQAAIRAWQEQSYTMVHYDCVDQLVVDEIMIENDMALLRGRFAGTITLKDGSGAFNQEGYFFNILEREDDSQWRIARMIWNYTPPQ